MKGCRNRCGPGDTAYRLPVFTDDGGQHGGCPAVKSHMPVQYETNSCILARIMLSL